MCGDIPIFTDQLGCKPKYRLFWSQLLSCWICIEDHIKMIRKCNGTLRWGNEAVRLFDFTI